VYNDARGTLRSADIPLAHVYPSYIIEPKIFVGNNYFNFGLSVHIVHCKVQYHSRQFYLAKIPL
jgi:hypothetical protein